jgi:hypothetical protein
MGCFFAQNLTVFEKPKPKDQCERGAAKPSVFAARLRAGLHEGTHPHAIIHGNEAGCVPFPLIPLLQEQQKILRGRFGCHHLYPMH